ncbi:MAG: S16 family serine protease, partial [Ilumatobacteraceae bacterium]
MKRTPVAIAVALVLVATACSSKSSTKDDGGTTKPTDGGSQTTDGGSETSDPATTEPTKASSVVIRPMYYNQADGKGGLAEFAMSLAESSDGALRVEFSEDEVIGMGDQYRASVWNAVTVATLLTGSPLKGTFRAEVRGYIDGPSAGMLTTVAVLALLRGDSLDPTVTMTGTVNPDGTVGPVGGIPEKITGLAEQGIKTVLIPTGQRNSPNETDGSLVDVVQLGQDNGVTVQEVSNVYEAYKAFTGTDLPRLQGRTPRLDETTYQRLKAKADEALAKYDGAITALAALDPGITAYVTSLSDEAIATAERARNLEAQGLQAGAFSKAWEAYAYAEAALSMAQKQQTLINQGVDAYFTSVLSSQAVTGETTALFDTLKTFTPESLTDASVLMQTYGAALDAYTVATSASRQLTNLQNAFANGEITLDDLAGAVIAPTAFLEISGAMVEYAKAIFDVGRDLEGAPVKSDIDLPAVANFFRKASDANFAAFQTVVV